MKYFLDCPLRRRPQLLLFIVLALVFVALSKGRGNGDENATIGLREHPYCQGRGGGNRLEFLQRMAALEVSTNRKYNWPTHNNPYRCPPGRTSAACRWRKCPYSIASGPTDLRFDHLYTPGYSKPRVGEYYSDEADVRSLVGQLLLGSLVHSIRWVLPGWLGAACCDVVFLRYQPCSVHPPSHACVHPPACTSTTHLDIHPPAHHASIHLSICDLYVCVKYICHICRASTTGRPCLPCKPAADQGVAKPIGRGSPQLCRNDKPPPLPLSLIHI